MTLTVGSLFSGIGGIDLGLERAGMNVLWHSEIDPYACRVLKKHWPDVPNIGDITQVDWSNIPYVDVIAGGYPCQPFSLAGRRKGEEDSRHLWPYFRNAISHLRPRYALLENVRGHLSMGGVSVIGDLTALGYDCEWRIISAASVGANHRRDRLIIVAYSRSELRGNVADCDYSGSCDALRPRWDAVGNGGQDVADTDGADDRASEHGDRLRERNSQASGEERRSGVFDRFTRSGENRTEFGWDIAKWWQTEPDVGRMAHGIPSRLDRLKGLGNAVVPQVAEVVGRLIVSHANN